MQDNDAFISDKEKEILVVTARVKVEENILVALKLDKNNLS